MLVFVALQQEPLVAVRCDGEIHHGPALGDGSVEDFVTGAGDGLVFPFGSVRGGATTGENKTGGQDKEGDGFLHNMI